MFCGKCGAQIEDGSKFCVACGNKIEVIEEATQEVTAAIDDAVQTTEAVVEETTQAAETVVEESAQVAESVVEETVQAAAPVVEETVQAAAPAVEEAAQTVAPVVGQPVNGQPMMQNAQQMAPNAPKKKMSKKAKTILFSSIGAVAALLIAFLVFFLVGSNKYDYKNTAKDYVTALVSADWDKVLEYVDVPESEFTSAESLKAVKRDVIADKITSIEVTDTNEALNNALGDLADLLGTSRGGSVKSDTKRMVVTYQTANNGGDTISFTMKNSGEKGMLFFDKYKVDGSSLVASNYKVTVLSNATAYVDGIKLEDKYIDGSATTNGQKTYVIPSIFKGSHTLKVTNNGMKDYEAEMKVTNSGSIKYVKAELLDETMDKIKAKSIEDTKALYDAAINRKAFDSIKNYFVSYSNYTSTLKSNYESFMKYEKSSDTVGITSITWNTVDSTVAQQSNVDGKVVVKATVKVNANYKYNTSSKKDQSATNKAATMTFYYMEEGTDFKLYKTTYGRIY